MRFLRLAAVACAIAAAAVRPVAAQAAPDTVWSTPTPPQAHVAALSAQARAFLDSLADLSRRTRTEQAGCMTGYRVSGDTLVIDRMQPTVATFTSDSVTIVAQADLCNPGVPVLHTHVATGRYLAFQRQPSAIDVHTARLRGVFGLLLAVPPDSEWKLVLYP
jgi:hypothetical protein